MIEWVISSSILISVILVLRRLLRGRISARLQYALWGLVLLRLMIPFNLGHSALSLMNTVEDLPVVQEAQSLRGVDEIWHSSAGTVEGYHAHDSIPDAPTVVAGYKTEAEFARMEHILRLRELFTPVRRLGTAALLLLFFISNRHFAGRLRQSRQPLELSYAVLPVYVTRAVETPCLFGLFSPAAYVTPEAANDETVLRHSVEHETTHLRHRDNFWAGLRLLCLALHWYNPLVWWAALASRADSELACDEGTIRRIGEAQRAEYGRTLLRMTCQKRTDLLLTATTMTGSGHSIRQRISLIAKKPKTALCTLLALLLAITAAVGFTFTGAEAKDVFAKWLSSVDASQITYAQASQGYGREQRAHVLSAAEHAALADILNNIPAQALSRQESMGTEVCSILVVTESDGRQQEHLFRCGADGAVWVNFDDTTAKELSAGKEYWRLDAPELTAYVGQLVTDLGQTPEAFSDDVLTADTAVADKVCIAIMPTGVSVEGGDYLYVPLPQQEAALAAYKKAAAAAAAEERWLPGEESSGIWVVYQDSWWQFTRAGAMIGRGRVEAPDASELYALCTAVAEKAGLGKVVRPSDIHGIVSAELHWNGTHRITEPAALAQIEGWLSASEELIGGASCWFTGLLTLNLESGESLTIAMATDDCATWMSEGVCYQYPLSDNREFYALFAPESIPNAMVQNFDSVR